MAEDSKFTKDKIQKALYFTKLKGKTINKNSVEISGKFDNCLCVIEGDNLKVTYRNKVNIIRDAFEFLKFLDKLD